MKNTYKLIDSGSGQKLEQFGPHLLQRPCSQALWEKQYPEKWKPDASFTREPEGKWSGHLPKNWTMELHGIQFLLKPTDFGHLGIFPEHSDHWGWMQDLIKGKDANILNLFAYSGGATLACARAGAQVCHLDAAQGMVDWAKENAELNRMEEHPIRWIVDDALKFMRREVKRGRRYEGIILDPPSFGRGKQGQVFKIEDDLPELIKLCHELLSDQALFILLSCHTPGITPLVLHHMLGGGDYGEMTLSGNRSVPSGSYARRLYES